MKNVLTLLCAFVGTHSVTIAQPGTVEFSQPLYTISETASAAFTDANNKKFIIPTMTVTRNGGSTCALTVDFCVWPDETSDSALEYGPSATGNYRFLDNTCRWIFAGTLTWADGDASVKTFSVPLPATGNVNGALDVAINLSAPTNSAVIGTVAAALLTIQNQSSTVYNINDNTDGSTYRVSLPPGPGPVRGILYWWPGTGGDDRRFTTDPTFRKTADQWRFARAPFTAPNS